MRACEVEETHDLLHAHSWFHCNSFSVFILSLGLHAYNIHNAVHHLNDYFFCRQSEIVTSLASIKKSLHQQTKVICGVLSAITSPVPVSSKSEREQHQTEFRTNVIEHYELEEVQNVGTKRGIDPTVKCMITGLYFPPNHVAAGHAVGLHDRERALHIFCGMTDGDIWDVRNGIMWLKEIQTAKDHLHVVC